jgi:hypothetical protein
MRRSSILLLPTVRPAACYPLPPAAKLYVKAFGWPISVEAGEVTVTCGDVLDVTTMPAGFASEVNHLLRLHLLMTPIIELAADTPGGSTRWAFLSQPRQPTYNEQQLEKLAGCDVQHFGMSATFPLPPSPTGGNEPVRWRVPPPYEALPPALPPWASVASCALKVKYSSTGR